MTIKPSASRLCVIAVFGPTASGKSAVAAAVADRAPGDMISADAMKVYRGVPVLTNQPTELTSLVGIWPLSHQASVGEYQELAHVQVDRSLAAGRTPVVVGGSGLYLRAAIAELSLPPATPTNARQRYEAVYEREGAQAAHALLTKRDPEAASAIHRNDRKRVVRALELAEGGHSLRPAVDRLWSKATRHPTMIFGLELPAEALEKRIRARTRRMIEGGAEAEARRAMSLALSATARHVIGLEELTTLTSTEAEDAIAVRTRRYAAYQRKWMRRIPCLTALDATRSPDQLANEILEVARSW